MTGVAQTLEVAPFIRATLSPTDDVVYVRRSHATHHTVGVYA